ncbi:MAG: hypothetical protein IJ770_02930 [Alphaproteobacteria bacterium]|nr:hypothetical protein [Alphaproteobacteria bacterium]
MKKMVFVFLAMTTLLLCSCGTSDMFVAAPVPGLGSVVVASNPVNTTVGVSTPAATVVYSTPAPRTYVTYPYGYYSSGYYYSAPAYRRRLPPPPPPRKRNHRRY